MPCSLISFMKFQNSLKVSVHQQYCLQLYINIHITLTKCELNLSIKCTQYVLNNLYIKICSRSSINEFLPYTVNITKIKLWLCYIYSMKSFGFSMKCAQINELTIENKKVKTILNVNIICKLLRKFFLW